MLAYVSWHRPSPGVERAVYEHALERFHRSLAHRPPGGFEGSASLIAAELPWLGAVAGAAGPSAVEGPGAEDPGGYEDWYFVDGWSAIGVLEEAAVSRGHLTAHDAVAAKAGVSTAGIYRLSEGRARLAEVRVSVWVARGHGHEPPTIAALLGDGMDPAAAGLWRRCLGLGPAPEHCLLASEPPAGVGDARLPRGWTATVSRRDLLWAG